ncbi:polysaccharide export protein EpsE [Sulfuriferula multivorans]|nr:polysaccharide export protein EpsE [Sulfuriferula multivorans]
MSLMRALLVFILLFVVGFAMPASAKEYLLGSGDILRITVYDQPDLTLDTRVNESGAISFPLIGDVHVAGETATTAQNRIAEKLLKGGFVKNPQVNLIVTQYRSKQVSVLGQVNRPGKYPLENTSTLTDILAQAGGINPAGADTLVLIHKQTGKAEYMNIDTLALYLDGKANLDMPVADEDIIYVPRAPLFYIYGEVQRPGSFRLERGMSVMQALSVGGGVTLRGTQRGIEIRRRDADGKEIIIKPSLSDSVHPDDVIYVQESLL